MSVSTDQRLRYQAVCIAIEQNAPELVAELDFDETFGALVVPIGEDAVLHVGDPAASYSLNGESVWATSLMNMTSLDPMTRTFNAAGAATAYVLGILDTVAL